MVLPADTEAPGAAHLPLPSPPLPIPPLDSLHLLECHRCGEPMYHYLGELVGDFPLFRVWEVSCGECGALVEACEELVTAIRFQTPPDEAIDDEEE